MAMDFLLDDDFDVVIENGDFAMGESLEDDIRVILMSRPGDFPMSPFSGTALGDFLNSRFSLAERTALEAELRLQMELHQLPYRPTIDATGELKLNSNGTDPSTNI